MAFARIIVFTLISIALITMSPFIEIGKIANAQEIKVDIRPTQLPAIELIDHNDGRFDLSGFQDQWSLLFLGYTFCPDICPMTLFELSGVIDSFEQRYPNSPLPQIVFVAVDPERDKVGLGDYVTSFHSQTIGVTGDRDQIESVVEAMNGFYQLEPPDGDGEYMVQHSSSICIVDPAGRIVARFNPPLDADAAADQLFNVMRRG